MTRQPIMTVDAMEQLIDIHGAWNVMLAMELTLGEKAEHIRANWQDKQSARVYDRFARKCGTLAREMEAANI